MAVWKEIYTAHEFNTITAAAAIETIADTTGNRRLYGPFNSLFIKNRDAVAIQIALDGLSEEGFLFEISAGETFILKPEEGIKFSFITQKNIDAATAEVADTILFRWAKSLRVD